MEENNSTIELKWYVVHTYSGYEKKVMGDIERRVAQEEALQGLIVDVKVPEVESTEFKDGKRHTYLRKLYPGYVMVKMHMTDRTWYVVRNTRGVTGFVGTGNTPVPLTDEEVVAMNIERIPTVLDIHEGDLVSVIAGPFEGFEGHVVKVDSEHEKVKLIINMFHKETPMELDYYQVRKL